SAESRLCRPGPVRNPLRISDGPSGRMSRQGRNGARMLQGRGHIDCVKFSGQELPTTGTGRTRKGTFLFQYEVVASRPSKMARREPRPPTRQIAQFQESDCPGLRRGEAESWGRSSYTQIGGIFLGAVAPPVRSLLRIFAEPHYMAKIVLLQQGAATPF